MNQIKKCQAKMAEKKWEAVLVTSQYNRVYITHFTGTSGAALILMDEAYFITDFRYVEQAKKQTEGFEIIQQKSSIEEEVKRLLQKHEVSQLVIEDTHMTIAAYWELQQQLPEVHLVPMKNELETMRFCKNGDEITAIRQACQMADNAFKHIIHFIKPGMTEREIANELDFFMRQQGSLGASFDMIVASGKRSALPHGVASDKQVAVGDFITLDYGCYYNGYCSDMTRTVALGKVSSEQRDVYQTVLEAQLKVREQLKPGMNGKEVDKIARDHISEKGYGAYFGHSLGHGLGLEVHEGPYLSAKSTHVLKPGHVVTNEPGIYLPERFGVRIEDDLLLTATGKETMTMATKELIIL